MKIIALSDMHGNLPVIEPCDLCIIAGDSCPYQNESIDYQYKWLRNEFSRWLQKIPAKNIVGIAGNHDRIFDHYQFDGKTLPWTYLENSSVTIGNTTIFGSPYCKRFTGSPFMRSEEELALLYSKLNSCDIFVSHGPPYGYGDKTAVNGSLVNVGSKELLEALWETECNMCICGHIHENYGSYDIIKGARCKVHNVAIVDNRYKVVNRPMIIHI